MSIATNAVFLFKGFEDERHHLKASWPDLEAIEGLTGLVGWIESMAQEMEAVWEAEQSDHICPGVYDYDITEPMGAWLYHNVGINTGAFAEELRRRFNEWLNAKPLGSDQITNCPS